MLMTTGPARAPAESVLPGPASIPHRCNGRSRRAGPGGRSRDRERSRRRLYARPPGDRCRAGSRRSAPARAEVAVGVATDADRLGVEGIKETVAEGTAGAAVGVEEGPQPGGADVGCVNQFQHAVAVPVLRLPAFFAAWPVCCQPARWKESRLKERLHLSALGGAEHAASAAEEFETVPGSGIVAGSNLDAAAHPVCERPGPPLASA